MIFHDTTGWRKWWVLLAVSLLVLFGTFSALLGISHLADVRTSDTHYRALPDIDAAYPKSIALTFDDGPDPRYTEPIVRLLRQYDVPATFFLLGESVVRYPDLARLIATEGFEIGNHTFTHSPDAHESRERLHRELIAADRAIRDATGYTSVLYRPPFLLDIAFGPIDGSTVDAAPLRWAEEAGYSVVGTNVDSLDWDVAEGDSASILARLRSQIDEGANVVLLHDHGGDGAALEALETFIPEMLAQGYRFVPVSAYFDIPLGEAHMRAPAPTADQIALVSMLKAYVFGVSWLDILASAVGALVITRIIVILTLRKVYIPIVNRRPRPRFRAPVSVLIPAYNEEANIAATLHSVFKAQRPGDQIIVIDDGSTDGTARIVQSMDTDEHPVLLLRKQNGGTKSGALAYGLPYAVHEIIVCIDADTIVESQAFTRLTHHFALADVGAVAGKVYPAHTGSLLSKFQYIEYVQGQNLDKEVMSAFNAVSVIPGALGAWRLSALRAIGGFPHDTVVEDQDLTLALLKEGWRVVYEPRSMAFTGTPHSVRNFLKQRLRWVFGTLQCMWKYRSYVFSMQRPSLGFLVLPNVVIFNILLPLFVPFLDIALLAGFAGYVDLSYIAALFLLYFAFDIWYSVEAMAHEQHPKPITLLVIPLQRWFYRYAMAATIMRSIARALSGGFARWGAQQRTGDCHALLPSIVAPITTRSPASSF